eukprot:8108954-Pyramimonas_sp.AAC.1
MFPHGFAQMKSPSWAPLHPARRPRQTTDMSCAKGWCSALQVNALPHQTLACTICSTVSCVTCIGGKSGGSAFGVGAD